jgi:hypothetical protein
MKKAQLMEQIFVSLIESLRVLQESAHASQLAARESSNAESRYDRGLSAIQGSAAIPGCSALAGAAH